MGYSQRRCIHPHDTPPASCCRLPIRPVGGLACISHNLDSGLGQLALWPHLPSDQCCLKLRDGNEALAVCWVGHQSVGLADLDRAAAQTTASRLRPALSGTLLTSSFSRYPFDWMNSQYIGERKHMAVAQTAVGECGSAN